MHILDPLCCPRCPHSIRCPQSGHSTYNRLYPFLPGPLPDRNSLNRYSVPLRIILYSPSASLGIDVAQGLDVIPSRKYSDGLWAHPDTDGKQLLRRVVFPIIWPPQCAHVRADHRGCPLGFGLITPSSYPYPYPSWLRLPVPQPLPESPQGSPPQGSPPQGSDSEP